jgi:hypothetical protein
VHVNPRHAHAQGSRCFMISWKNSAGNQKSGNRAADGCSVRCAAWAKSEQSYVWASVGLRFYVKFGSAVLNTNFRSLQTIQGDSRMSQVWTWVWSFLTAFLLLRLTIPIQIFEFKEVHLLKIMFPFLSLSEVVLGGLLVKIGCWIPAVDWVTG